MRKSFTILTGILVCAFMAKAAALPTKTLPSVASVTATASLSSADLATRIVAARQLLQASAPSGADYVRLAVFDSESDQLGVITLPKQEFLTRDAIIDASTSLGAKTQIKVVRANGVNTAVVVTDDSGRRLTPLLVQYPIVKSGAISEIAYYTSAHPALLSDEVTSKGQSYIQTRLGEAAARLASQGIVIPSDIVGVAEHLCVVEHTDHKRFMTEDQGALFPEILSLYALNEGNTFRYSVSTAGAGGMIQMIPRTYDAIRQTHSAVTLNSDFVTGMRDHENALEAMLLYMNDTWNELAKHSEVQEALSSGVATKPELLAAGYNSNPMRLPGYLKNGGTGWRDLIPAETQMYLAIYKSVDTHVPFDELHPVSSNSQVDGLAMSTPRINAVPFFAWFGPSLLNNSALVWLR